MDYGLVLILKDYIEKVNDVCTNLLIGFNLNNKYDFYEYRKAHRLMEFRVNGIYYMMHGRGCFASTGKYNVDWDFGYRSRWCGIDPWLLARTLEENMDDCAIYYKGDVIKEACEQAVKNDEMFKKHEQYYFTISANETFKPDFPSEYDTVVIRNFNKQWIISRNKVIDSFIKKSSRIYNEIDNSPNPYELKFLLGGNVIYSILYDDIGYPEKAIEIMDNILSVHQQFIL